MRRKNKKIIRIKNETLFENDLLSPEDTKKLLRFLFDAIGGINEISMEEAAGLFYLKRKDVDEIYRAYKARGGNYLNLDLPEGTMLDVSGMFVKIADMDEDQRDAYDMIVGGMSLASVAEYYDVNKSTVGRWIRKMGAKVSSLRAEFPIQRDKDQICLDVYRRKNDGETWAKLVTDYGLSHHSVRVAYRSGKILELKKELRAELNEEAL